MLNIHFINVGKGSCTIIDFPSGNLTMVDIDNCRVTDESILTDPVEYFLDRFKGRALFRFILTHPDMDHLSGLDELARKVSILNFWDTEHTKTLTEADFGGGYGWEDWERYQQIRNGHVDANVLNLYRGSTSSCCWTQDCVRILSPSKQLVRLANETEESNHLSYVLMIEHAGIRVLLGGDATVEAWEEILNVYGADALKADIFFAPHHGSKHSVHETAFAAVAPEIVVISVAEGVDYAYQYYSALASEAVLITRHHGTIRVEIQDNGEYWPIYVERDD